MVKCDIYSNPTPTGIKENVSLWNSSRDDFKAPSGRYIGVLRKGSSTCDSFHKSLGIEQVTISVYPQLVENTLSGEFSRLRKTWKSETAHLSSVTEIVMHPAYQRIIGMGQIVIPLILSELEREPDLWFWALTAITGYNPILPEQRGHIQEMTKSWVTWGREQGYLNESSEA
jgi:hypothetical protein